MAAANDPRVQLLAELADETRYAVLERLEQGQASASELAERLDVSPTRLANHLRRLRDAGLVAVSHQGRLALYELAEPGLREICLDAQRVTRSSAANASAGPRGGHLL